MDVFCPFIYFKTKVNILVLFLEYMMAFSGECFHVTVQRNNKIWSIFMDLVWTFQLLYLLRACALHSSLPVYSVMSRSRQWILRTIGIFCSWTSSYKILICFIPLCTERCGVINNQPFKEWLNCSFRYMLCNSTGLYWSNCHWQRALAKSCDVTEIRCHYLRIGWEMYCIKYNIKCVLSI